MDNKKGITGGIIAVSVVSGAVLGAVAGLLLAPQPGKKTREKISKVYGEISDQVHELVERANTDIPDMVSKASSEIRVLPDEVRKELLKLKDDTVLKIEKIVGRGKSVFDEVKDNAFSSIKEGKKQFLKEKDKLINRR